MIEQTILGIVKREIGVQKGLETAKRNLKNVLLK